MVNQKTSNTNIYLRPATMDDDRLLWQWANDPQTRSVSFSTEPIPWSEHLQWVTAALSSPECFLWIAVLETIPIGQVRFNSTGFQDATISINLAPDIRGQGYAKQVIQSACQKLLEETGIQTIHAYIKTVNLASIRAFEAAYFSKVDVQLIQGIPAFHYIYTRT